MMKIPHFFLLFVTIISLLFVTACSSGDSGNSVEISVKPLVFQREHNEKKTVNIVKDHEDQDKDVEETGFSYTGNPLYDELIEKVLAGIKTDFTDISTEDLDISVVFNYKNDYEVLGYMLKDIDGDGLDELLFGCKSPTKVDPSELNQVDRPWDSIIYDIYTIKDGKLSHVLDGWERNRYYLCEDGTLLNEASGGAAHSVWAYYNYSVYNLSMIECVFTDDRDDEGGFYYSTDEPFSDKCKAITEEKAHEIILGHKIVALQFISFNENPQ